MKKILSILLMSFCYLFSFSQAPIVNRTTGANTVNDPRLQAGLNLFIPRYLDTTAANIQKSIDSCGAIIYTYSGNKIWQRSCSPKRWEELGGGSSILAANGVKLLGDTSILGDSLNRFTYIQVLSHLAEGTRFNHLRFGNLPESQSIGGTVPVYPYVSTYNPSTLSIDRLYSEANHDTASLQYGGGFSGVTRINYDSFPSIYGASIVRPKDITLASQGVEYLYQVNFPRDTARIAIGRDGQQGSVFVGQTDYGQTWGYNINVYSPASLPDMPISTYKANLDFQRNIDNTRRYKMTGNGVAQYLSAYKTYQTTINMATYEAGDYVSKIMGFHAYGTMYTNLSGATKAKTLLVSAVDSSFGFVAEPQYRYTNDIVNGYGLWMKGDSDYNHINGFLTVGGILPTRANGGQLFRYKLNVTGKGHFTDSLISDGNIAGFVVKGQGMIVSINTGVGSEAGINYLQTDSAITGSTLAYVPANRDLRGFAIRSEGYSAANYSNDGIGMFVQIETGANHLNLTRWHRNGNMAVGYANGITTPYRLYKKLTVNGASAFLDTITIKNLILRTVDSTGLKVLAVDAIGNVYKTYWGNAGAGGGSGTLTNFSFTDGNGFVGSVTNPTTTPTLQLSTGIGNSNIVVANGGAFTGSNTLTFNGATLYSYATNDVNFEVESGSDLSGMQITPTKTQLYGPTTSTNTIVTLLDLKRQTGIAANGIGSAIDFTTEDDGGVLVRSNRIESSFTTVTNSATTSRFSILGRSSGTEQEVLGISGTGAVKLNSAYGSNTFTGTATYGLAVDASGNLITVAISSGGITIGTSTIANGTNTRILYNNSGVVGEYTISGSGNVAMTISPSFTTPILGTPTSGTLTNTTGYIWNNLTNPTGSQIISWDDAELNSWTNGSNTETFHTVDNNSLTTGISYRWNTSSITTGNLLSLVSTSTAANAFSLLNITSSGANANSTRTAIGGLVSVTNTGPTSTNYGLQVTASGATNNWGIQSTPNIIIGSPTLNANDGLILTNRDNGNYSGISIYSLSLATRLQIGQAGITRGGGIDINTTSGGLSLSPLTGVYIGTAFTAPTALLHIKAGTATASTAPFKLTTGVANTTPEPGAMEYTTPQLFFTNGGAVRQELFQGQQARVSTQFDKTNTTLANITGLTANVAAGKTYRFQAVLYTTSDVAGGVKVAIGGTATATAVIYEGFTIDAGTTTQGRATTLGTAVGAITAVTAACIRINGTITVNAAGTLTCQFAENAATATSSVLVGSTFHVIEML